MSTTYQETTSSPTVPGLMFILPLLAIWSGAILTMGLNGVFQASDGAPPIAVGIALLTPPALFLLAYRLIAPVRDWVASLDMIVVTAVQAWRVAGAAFVILWALGDLPITFAAPAGLGDVAVGIFAVSVTVMVARRSAGWRAASWSLITFGLLDFVGAFGTAVLSGGGRFLDFANAPDPTMMQSAPMVMIPGFAVPLFIICHLIAWIKLKTED